MSDITPTAELKASIPDSTAGVLALLKTGAALGKPCVTPGKDGKPYTVLPAGFKLAELPTRPLPDRPISQVKLRDAASFIAYFNDHKLARSRIYASMEPASFLAVFDDFDTPIDPKAGDFSEQADWREFRAEFKVPASREWTTWSAIDRKDLNQIGFAEFLQDNLPDVVVPDSASLLDMVLNFEAVQGGKVVANQRLQDGSTSLQFVSDTNATGTVKLPDVITLKIPVFENEAPTELICRLRYKIKRDDGTISFKIERVRPHKVLEAAFRATWARIAAETGSVILLGSPE